MAQRFHTEVPHEGSTRKFHTEVPNEGSVAHSGWTWHAQRADYELTPHETRLLRMLVDGHNYKTAALELGVSVNTIAFHMKRIYEKLQVHSRSPKRSPKRSATGLYASSAREGRLRPHARPEYSPPHLFSY